MSFKGDADQQATTEKTAGDTTVHTRQRSRLVYVLGAIMVAMLAMAVATQFISRPLMISEKTTYITEPLKANGEQVDYFAAMEQELYPPEMQTDGNGYRLIVQTLGPAVGSSPSPSTPATQRQVCEKLGLTPAMSPTHTFQQPYDFLEEFVGSSAFDESLVERLDDYCWMDPTKELSEKVAKMGINYNDVVATKAGPANPRGVGSGHPEGANVGLRQGAGRFVSEVIDLEHWRELLEGSSEPVD